MCVHGINSIYIRPFQKNDSEARLLKDNSNNCKIESIVEAIANGKNASMLFQCLEHDSICQPTNSEKSSRIRLYTRIFYWNSCIGRKPTTIITTLPIISVSFSRYPFIDAPFVTLVFSRVIVVIVIVCVCFFLHFLSL